MRELEIPPSLKVLPGLGGFEGTVAAIRPIPLWLRGAWGLSGPALGLGLYTFAPIGSDEVALMLAIAGTLFAWLGAGWGISVWRDDDALPARLDGVRLTLGRRSWSLAELDEVRVVPEKVTRLVIRSGRRRWVYGFERPHHAGWLRDAILKAMSRLEGDEDEVPDDLRRLREKEPS